MSKISRIVRRTVLEKLSHVFPFFILGVLVFTLSVGNAHAQVPPPHPPLAQMTNSSVVPFSVEVADGKLEERGECYTFEYGLKRVSYCFDYKKKTVSITHSETTSVSPDGGSRGTITYYKTISISQL
ncbi:hypothetical protein OAO01_03205 [Oligoflexia bacterium]|nr:hypothetical protein [Oligoflexia bacterium]